MSAVYICYGGENICCGRFDDEVEPASTYDHKVFALFSAFAQPNIPKPSDGPP